MSFPKVEECLPKNWGLFYGGRWHEPGDGDHREIYSPGDGKVIRKVAFAGAKDTAAAIEAAHAAFPAWRAVPSLERGKTLRKVAEILRQHADELALLDSYNTGNPVSMMRADAHSAADTVDMFVGL